MGTSVPGRNFTGFDVRAITVLTVLSLAGTGFLLALTDNWQLLRVPQAFDSRFVDLQYLTASAECYRNDASWSLSSITCDPFGRPNNYPSPWVWLFGTLGVTYQNTESIAIGYIALFALAVGVVSYFAVKGSNKPWLIGVPVWIAAFAPPTWLMLERGSNEVVIFSLVVCAMLAHLSSHPLLTSVTLVVGTVLKFFPAGAALSLLRNWPKGKWGLILFVGGTLLGLLLISGEIQLIAERTPQPTEAAFGASIFFRMVGVPSARVFGVLLVFVVAMGLVVVLSSRLFPKFRQDFTKATRAANKDPVAAALLVFGGGPLIAAFILGTNYDYRFIYAIPLVGGLMRIGDSTVARLLSAFMVVAAIGTYPAPDAMEFAVDLALLVVLPVIGWLVLAASGLRFGRLLARVRRTKISL